MHAVMATLLRPPVASVPALHCNVVPSANSGASYICEGAVCCSWLQELHVVHGKAIVLDQVAEG